MRMIRVKRKNGKLSNLYGFELTDGWFSTTYIYGYGWVRLWRKEFIYV